LFAARYAVHNEGNDARPAYGNRGRPSDGPAALAVDSNQAPSHDGHVMDPATCKAVEPADLD
jgi:hypothetical protein